MATLSLLILALACLSAHAIPPKPLPTSSPTRNTIFGDEKLEGEVFENLDTLENAVTVVDTVPGYRLPRTTVPYHYNVFWSLDMVRLAHEGTVDIILQATQAGVQDIVIQSHELEILSVVFRLENSNVAIPVTFREEPDYHLLIVSLQNSAFLEYNLVNPVYYRLTISFGAELRTDMYGIYRSWFRNTPSDDISWMASTQFQPTAARSAFPCYDEPSFKATFNITIRRPTNYRSWSATKISETSNVTGTTLFQDDVFYTTPKMSTYLLAIIVAEYDRLLDGTIDNYNYEVIARPSAIASGQADYAFDVGQELLAKMNEHTSIDYYSTTPNLKMTQAAIPDFGAGAMENWGLLTYREAYLLHDENNTNGYFKQLIAYILSHEIAHMWFGNLVTCEWWEYLWLNEGFARYYQYFLTHWVEDYMGLETRFITEQIHTSLLSDSSNSPQPLSYPNVDSPASVSAMFSTISYNKGAAIIRMTEHLLGFEVHRQGLQRYLTVKAFDYALPSDLFDALQFASDASGAMSAYGNVSISDYYNSWTVQSGHPVLNVDVDHSTGQMTITQRRFNINTGYASTNLNSLYYVPITFATASNPDFVDTKPSHVLTEAVTVINRGSVGQEWVIFNKQQTGFYRVNYDDYTWNLIALALRGNERTLIHEYNKAQIVNDVFQFARSGIITYTRAFKILSFLEFETEYAPWVAALTGFSWIRNRLTGAQLTEVNNLIARWSTNVMAELTYYPIANETFMRSYLRYQLAPVLCAIGVQACRTAATAQFRALLDSNAEVPADSRNWVYCNGLRDGTVADFNSMYTRFLTHNLYTEKILLLMTLGCTPHQASLNTLLDDIVQDNFIIRPQDYTTAFSTAVSGNEVNTQIVFTYIQNNLANVTAAFGSPVTPLSYVSARLRTIAEVNAFQTWATANQAVLGNSYQAIFNGAETSRQSIQWATAVTPDLTQFFENDYDDISTTTTTLVPVVPAVTESLPVIIQPETPELPSSAATSFVSMFAVLSALIAKFVL